MTQPKTMPALADEVRALLTTDRFGRSLRGFDAVGSTNTEAMRWAADGAPEGSVVVAEYQSAGRGRQGRRWEAAAGKNLMASILLRPAFAPERFGLITLAGGVGVAEAVAERCAPHPVSIKWPNDVLIEGRKCCGMLLEASASAPAPPVVVLGIGLNVNQRSFPPPLDGSATSLLLETGRLVPRAPLLADVLARVERWYDTISDDGGRMLRTTYEQHLTSVGETVTLRVTDATHAVRGTLLGVTDTGALRLETADGIQTFLAGDVTMHPPSDG